MSLTPVQQVEVLGALLQLGGYFYLAVYALRRAEARSRRVWRELLDARRAKPPPAQGSGTGIVPRFSATGYGTAGPPTLEDRVNVLETQLRQARDRLADLAAGQEDLHGQIARAASDSQLRHEDAEARLKQLEDPKIGAGPFLAAAAAATGSALTIFAGEVAASVFR